MSSIISCTHPGSLSTFSCPSLRENDTAHTVKIICSTCFDEERQSAQVLSLAPLSEQHFCMDCGRNPARYSKSLMMAMCDACRTEQGSSFLQFSFHKAGKDKGNEIPNDIFEGRLYLGSQDAASNREIFTRLRVTHILVCGNGINRFYEDENFVRYHQLPIDDSLDQNLEIYLPSGVQFIEDAINNGGNVLVHCHAGVSRSASLVIAWLMKRMNCDYHTAYSYVKSRRSKIHPNSNFVSSLQNYWEPLCDVKPNFAISTESQCKEDSSNSLTLHHLASGSVDDGLRSAMKSTATSIRRFSSERIDPYEIDSKMAATATSKSNTNPYADTCNEQNYRDEEEEEDDDFVLVLKSDEK